jgi:hypothetical protein
MLGGGVEWGWKLLSPLAGASVAVAADENAYRSSLDPDNPPEAYGIRRMNAKLVPG